MKKLLLASLCFLLLSITQVFAQDRTVTGTVTAKDDGLPIPGVTVKVKGTTIGTQTGSNGKFTLTVPGGAILQFSFIGYATVDLPAKGGVINVSLSSASGNLGEVVVTGALGLTRTRNQQSYAAQQISGDEVSKQRSSNFIDGLSGKVAGLEISQNNTLGGSTNVVLRGVKSFYGGNQALFVVDGVVMNNDNTNNSHGAGSGVMATQSTGGGGYDYGSPAADVNPDDIESITVLKGAGASALYGSQGANGVILITTKKAKHGLGIVFNTTLTDNSADKSTEPQYQTQYGAGYAAYFNPANIFGNPNAQVAPTNDDASNGTAFDPNLLIYQWNAFVPGLPEYGKATPWVAAKNNPDSFFINSLSTDNSILITNGGDNGSFKLGYTRSVDHDDVPNSGLIKNKVDFGATYNITPKLTVGASVNYSNLNSIGGEGTGYDGTNSDNRNVMSGFRQWWETNVDIKELKEAYDMGGGTNNTWNMLDPGDGFTNPAYWNNPYYVVEHNVSTSSRNRYIGNVNASYKATSWLSITARTSVDAYNEFDQERYDVSSIGIPYYSRYNKDFNETNFDLYANAEKDITPDFNLKGVLGTNIRKDYLNSVEAETNGGLIVPGLYSLSNTLNSPLSPTEVYEKKEVDGIYAEATLTWKKLLTLDGTVRRDVSSTLPSNSNTYYYPSVSAGFIFSELLKNYDWLSYGKIRANYAQVGSDANYYQVNNTYLIGAPYGSNPTTSVNPVLNNANLKPEQTKSKEIGLELDFFHNRLGFDGTYYTTSTFNELIPVNVSQATGYTRFYLNAGSIQNNGFELSLNGTPVKTQDFSWKITANWTRNRSKVTSLFKDGSGNEAKDLELGAFQNGESLNAPLGEAYGIIRGTDYTYNSKGQKEIYQTGSLAGQYIINESENNDIGNTNPDWTGGINDEFRYKSFTLSFLIDIKHGGSVFSNDLAYGLSDGIYPLTTYTNDLGNSVRAPLTNTAASGGMIREGVYLNGQTNTIRVSGNNYGDFGNGGGLLPLSAFVYDASYVKLREALIGYDLPTHLINKLGPVKGVTFQLIGRNLWIIHKNIPYADPEDGLSSGNLQGIQEGSYPTVRTISLNLKLQF
jgi:TonB-linked SusC/RagA family outer membrane protein